MRGGTELHVTACAHALAGETGSGRRTDLCEGLKAEKEFGVLKEPQADRSAWRPMKKGLESATTI